MLLSTTTVISVPGFVCFLFGVELHLLHVVFLGVFAQGKSPARRGKYHHAGGGGGGGEGGLQNATKNSWENTIDIGQNLFCCNYMLIFSVV
jgi:hypothetical protein